MVKNEIKWALIILVIVLLGYIVPFTLLTGVAAWYGSFLVWAVLALVTILINVIVTRNWGNHS